MYFAGPRASASQITSTLDSLAYAGLAAFVFAFSAGLDAKVIGSVVLANAIIVIPLCFLSLRVLSMQQFRPLCPIHFLLFGFAAWAGASYLWTLAPDRTTIRVGTYAALVIFAVLIWEVATDATRVRGLIASYVLGAGAASLTTIYNYLIGESTSRQDNKLWDTPLRYSVEGVNADELALIIALSIPMALYLVLRSQNRALKAACWAQVIAGFTAIFLSGTRGAMIALVVGLIALLRPTLSRMSGVQRGIAVLACIAILCCVVFFVPATLKERFLSIGTELSGGTLTHRTVLWSAGIEVFHDHPFIGVGAGAYGPAIASIVNIDTLGHNTFLSVLVELGVVGALILTALLAVLVYGVFRLPYLEKRTWLALLATWTIGVCSVSWENRKTTWFLFGLLAAQLYAKSSVLAKFVYQRRATRLPQSAVSWRPMSTQVSTSRRALER